MNRGSVLIVDDEKNIRLTLAMALETLNLQVEMAAHGEEALQKLAEKSYDLILLDMRLPGLDGMEVLGRVVKTWSQSKVIVITAYGSSEMAVGAMTLGAVDFLPKPFDPEDVRKTVTRILDQVALEKQRAQEEGF